MDKERLYKGDFIGVNLIVTAKKSAVRFSPSS
jgi:hypothetical protein